MRNNDIVWIPIVLMFLILFAAVSSDAKLSEQCENVFMDYSSCMSESINDDKPRAGLRRAQKLCELAFYAGIAKHKCK